MKALLTLCFASLLIQTLQAQFILTLNFEQMDQYEGKTLTVRVYENTTNREAGRKTVASIDTANFSLELYVLLRNRNYNVDWFVDVNENGEYDAPPSDHAWRTTVSNPTQDVTLTIIADANFTDTGWHNAFAYSQYDATWGGKWLNLTFGSTDSIQASLEITCDSVYGYFMTKGVFGNPQPVEFNFAIALSDTAGMVDTIKVTLPPPWSGMITIFNGDINASLSLMGVGLNFTGTLGEKQILCHYTVIVSGNPFANGYFYVRELTIHSSAPEIEVSGVATQVTCPGGNDGSVQLMVEGGIPGYTYLWSNGDTTQSLTGLSAGEYAVSVTDAAGCTEEHNFIIETPAPISITADFENASCFGVCDASIDITVTGGTPGYSYLWSIGVGEEDLLGTCAGVNSVTVTDALGCTAVLAVSIDEPSEITVTIFSLNPVCTGSCDGLLDITATGGQAPFQYLWNTGFSGNIAADLCAGDYTVTIIDAIGCSTIVEQVIIDPEPLVVSLVAIEHATNGGANGSIEISVTGGTPPYDPGFPAIPTSSGFIYTGLEANFYTLFILDVNGCLVQAGPFEILNISAVNDLENYFRLYPNPVASHLNVISDISVSIEVQDVHGNMLISSSQALSHKIPMQELAAGMYIAVVSDGRRSSVRKLLKIE